MTQRERIKLEIDKVREENLPVLLKIVQALEEPVGRRSQRRTTEWREFLDDTFGSCQDAPLQRGGQGQLERREPIR